MSENANDERRESEEQTSGNDDIWAGADRAADELGVEEAERERAASGGEEPPDPDPSDESGEAGPDSEEEAIGEEADPDPKDPPGGSADDTGEAPSGNDDGPDMAALQGELAEERNKVAKLRGMLSQTRSRIDREADGALDDEELEKELASFGETDPEGAALIRRVKQGADQRYQRLLDILETRVGGTEVDTMEGRLVQRSMEAVSHALGGDWWLQEYRSGRMSKWVEENGTMAARLLFERATTDPAAVAESIEFAKMYAEAVDLDVTGAGTAARREEQRSAPPPPDPIQTRREMQRQGGRRIRERTSTGAGRNNATGTQRQSNSSDDFWAGYDNAAKEIGGTEFEGMPTHFR